MNINWRDAWEFVSSPASTARHRLGWNWRLHLSASRELARQGHDVHVICLTKKTVTGPNPPMVKDDAIYKKAPEQLAHDVVQFVKGYHGHMHAFGENLSMRYRTGLGLKLLFTRPKLSAVKVALASGKIMNKLSNQPAGLPDSCSRLERTVENKSQEDWE